jgi:dihydropteroate synthase
MRAQLNLPNRTFDLTAPAVMGVLNVTPDSFSDGGRFLEPGAALAQARAMVEQGAEIVDVGGESTRPGAQPVSEQQELDRVVPVVERIRRELDCVISVDTTKPAVMRAACAAGAELINDVQALQQPGALEAAHETGAAVCLMHMQGEPRTMQRDPQYGDVVAEVRQFLAGRIAACEAAGIGADRLLVDPGFGFGKKLEHNLRLMAQLDAFATLGRPLLVGVSRKSMFQHLLGLPPGARLAPSLAAAALAVYLGAAIVRAHDVRETVLAVKSAAAFRGSR